MRNQSILWALALVGLSFCLPACNTIKGFGKDVHDSAQTVQVWIEGSDKNSDELSTNSSARAN